MTPEQRRTIYGHLNDALPSLNAVCTAASEAGDMQMYGDLLSARWAVSATAERLEKEMDDAVSDV